MSALEAIKKKSCQSCTRAKAKCSPHEAGGDVCYRCYRLSKECFFETSARKVRPKTRSRVSNLEQRFDTLIDLLATNGGAAKGPVLENTAVTPYRTNNTAVTAEPTVQNPPSYFTPAQTPTTSERGDTYPYDPVEAGIISSESASSLLKTYRSWDVSFPFVILKEDVTVDDLRRQKPFLFLAIMTVTTYATPSRQRALLEKLKSQIAHRVIEKSEKSLEIIQGLLIYVAWYIFFFKQQSNQLSIILQICVAMVFDIQLSKGPCQKRTPDSSGQREAVKGGRTAAEMRAYLGTYYFTVAIAHAWRKPSAMRHTKTMVRYYESLAKDPEHPTDTLIAPLIQLSELMMRVNDHFSYDSIQDAEIKGEMSLVMATDNFLHELQRIKEAVHPTHTFNRALQLKFNLLEIWIHEVSLHSFLWTPVTSASVPFLPPSRLKMFHRIQNAMSEYLMTISATPDSHLYSYSCCDWAGWFYCNIVACRLVFLTENDRQGHTAVEEVTNVLESVRPAADQRSASTNGSESQCDGTWDPARVARETRVQDQFESFINKMGFTMSSAFGLHGEAQIPIDPKNRDPLYTVVHLQQSILNTFLRRLRGQDTSKGTCCDDVSAAIYETRNKQRNLSHHNGSSYPEINTHSAGSSTGTSATEHPDIAHTRESLRVATMPLFKTVHINAIDFGSIQDTASTPGQQEMYDDWMWDTMMTDFTMPTL